MCYQYTTNYKFKTKKMGLDMSLKKVSREAFNNISKDDFWYEQFDISEELIYWRKQYAIDGWFHENTLINDECSDEITEEKLGLLIKWLKKEDLKDHIVKIKDVIKQTDFDNEVIFYTCCS